MFIPSPEWFAQAARWARQGYRLLRRQGSRDHTALWTGWYTKQWVNSYGPYFYAIGACAPSEHLRHPHEVSAPRVKTFLAKHIPLTFEDQPFQSYPEEVMFELKDDPAALPLHAMRVNSSGLVELFVRVPHEADSTGRITLDLVDAFQPLAWLLAAVRDGGYGELFGLRTQLRRLDWYSGLTPSISTNAGSCNWNDLRFPRGRPLFRGTQEATPNRPSIVHNHRQRGSPATVLAQAMTALVRDAGWDGNVTESVADTVEALGRQRRPESAS